MALRRLRLLVRACFSRWRRSPTSSELAQKRSKRGNIATALASERANFPDGDDGHLGLTAAYVATSGLTSQGPLPPPCLAGRSSRDPVSFPRVSFGHWHWGDAVPRHFDRASHLRRWCAHVAQSAQWCGRTRGWQSQTLEKGKPNSMFGPRPHCAHRPRWQGRL
jgi:hypothetical protein